MILFSIAGFGYENPERLKKAIAAQPKMYHDEMLYNTKLKIDSPGSEETLEDAKESQLKMRNKMNRTIVHTRYNKNSYELIRGRKPNVQYFHVFGSLCYLINNRDDLGKIKPKAELIIFISYSESSRGFRIYNCRTKKIMETIHVKFDELTAMASECNNSGPSLNCSIFQDSSEELKEISPQQDLDNLFGPMYEEYYAPGNSTVSNNFAANTLEYTPSPSSIIVEESDASQIVTYSEEPITQESSTLVLETHFDEKIQEDVI
nr:hypothetical protein [Tanacetum cinerariifolium]